jgi:hypothetical protein
LKNALVGARARNDIVFGEYIQQINLNLFSIGKTLQAEPTCSEEYTQKEHSRYADLKAKTIAYKKQKGEKKRVADDKSIQGQTPLAASLAGQKKRAKKERHETNDALTRKPSAKFKSGPVTANSSGANQALKLVENLEGTISFLGGIPNPNAVPSLPTEKHRELPQDFSSSSSSSRAKKCDTCEKISGLS